MPSWLLLSHTSVPWRQGAGQGAGIPDKNVTALYSTRPSSSCLKQEGPNQWFSNFSPPPHPQTWPFTLKYILTWKPTPLDNSRVQAPPLTRPLRSFRAVFPSRPGSLTATVWLTVDIKVLTFAFLVCGFFHCSLTFVSSFPPVESFLYTRTP